MEHEHSQRLFHRWSWGRSVSGLLAGLLLAGAPATALAQATIAGSVRDTSGGVLPGVTVEASSPALIEKVRTVSSDSEGLYRIVDLRPGTYTVTFTLTGFGPIRREGIQLTGSFTATVNAELPVGSLAETLTVSGQAPVVDVQSVTAERVLQRDVIDAIPTGSRSYQQLAALIPGIQTNTQIVGGVSLITDTVSIHGSRTAETQLLLDGMPYNHGGGTGGGQTGIIMNDGGVEEITLQVGATSAENTYGTILSNVIPKEGGNAFKGVVTGSFSNESLQSNNITDTQRAQGITSNGLQKVWDINPAFGGALLRDRLWYYTAYRYEGFVQYTTGAYFNTTPTAFVYTPDLSRPAISPTHLGSQNLRLTWRPTSKDKLTAFYDIQQHCECYRYKVGQGVYVTPPSPEAVPYYNWNPDYMAQMKWTSTMSSRLLLEVGGTYTALNFPTTLQEGMSPDTVGVTELSTGFQFRNIVGTYGDSLFHQYNTLAAASYVTGSHALKVGFTFYHGDSMATQNVTGNGVNLNLLRGVPSSLTVYATPLQLNDVLKANVGLYVQDRWTFNQLTLNAGVRFDYWNSYVPPQHAGPGPLVPTRNISFDQVSNVGNWKNVTPRLGVSYDLFGNGKTALKASVNKYLAGVNITSFTRAANPLAATVTSATRPILNGSFTPICDFGNTETNGDCGPLNNVSFGKPNVVTRYDPEVTGGNRGSNWETSASVQHQLVPGLSIDVGYFRRWFQNQTLTQNLAVSPADFDTYCITAPGDPRLPGGGGNQICGLYDVRPSSGKFGQTNNLITLAPDQSEMFNGVDANVTARLPHGILISGGAATGRTSVDLCNRLDRPDLVFAGSGTGVTAPRSEAFCSPDVPYLTQFKAYGVLPLPWAGFQTSATVKSYPGPQLVATAPIPNAQIAQTLGRNLAACGTAVTCTQVVTVDLIPVGSMYGQRLNQLDWRLTKTIGLAGSRRLRVNLDVFNLLNVSTVTDYNRTYGERWQYPTLILGARMFKFSGQFDF